MLPQHDANEPSARPGLAHRLGRMLATSLAVVASLLVFPSAIHWMAVVWLAWCSVLLIHGRRYAWAPLLACAAILLAKRIALLPGVVVFLVGVFAIAAFLGLVEFRAPTPLPRRKRIAVGAAVWGLWSILFWQWDAAAHASRRVPLLSNRPIVCFGDSLTSGVSSGRGYPEQLQSLVDVEVINYGRPGISTVEALKLLPEMLRTRPQAIVLELGGHDYLKGRSRAATKANLETIISSAQAAGAAVILVEVPRGFITDGLQGVERELAWQYDLELVSDSAIRELVLRSPVAPPGMWLPLSWHLSDDGLHSNASGDRHLADRVAESLHRLFGPAVAE